MSSNPTASEAEDEDYDCKHESRGISPARKRLRHCNPVEYGKRQGCRRGRKRGGRRIRETCSSRLNYGVGICKYTGSRGKGGASDAAAEAMGYVRSLFEANGVVWHAATLGKVDQGGGGTVAAYMANRNIVTVDAGVPVLCMHAPWELVSKYDCYMTMKAMTAVYKGL